MEKFLEILEGKILQKYSDSLDEVKKINAKLDEFKNMDSETYIKNRPLVQNLLVEGRITVAKTEIYRDISQAIVSAMHEAL